MHEITDEVIKKKHAEFNDRLKTVLEELRSKSSGMGQGFSPNIRKLRQLKTIPRLPRTAA